MDYEWDQAKNTANTAKHGVSFEAIYSFVWSEAVIFEDNRMDYGEARMLAFGPIGNRLYVCAFTDRATVRRVISLRKANTREVNMYLRERDA